MSKTSKKKEKEKKRPKRQERSFAPQSSHSPWLVRVLGALGAALLGAGVWSYSYGKSFADDPKVAQVPAYLVAAGAVLTGIAIWLGTSSDPPVRVGDPGISVQRGELRRMPWWGVGQISWESGTRSLVVSGTDESGSTWLFKVPLASHPEAVAWILKEADERVPKAVDIDDDVRERLPAASTYAGLKIELEPLQVVGRKDVKTGKTISYEPDGRVCARCERVYFKRSVPKKCKCGASLEHLRGAIGQDDDDDDESGDDAEETREDAEA